MGYSPGQRLEQYTIRRPQEVLIVKAEVAGVEDEILIFKGYSSSLMHATAFDPDTPVLSEQARIIAIDRLQGPYSPATPHYLERGLSWNAMQLLLQAVGL
jgi:hypothetical protein